MIFSVFLSNNNESLIKPKQIERICDFTSPGQTDRIKRIYFQLQNVNKITNLYSKLDKIWSQLLHRLEIETDDKKSASLLQTIYFLLGSVNKKSIYTKEEMKFIENVSESSILLLKGGLMLMKKLSTQNLLKPIASLISLLSYNKDFMNSPKVFVILKELDLWIDYDLSCSFLASILMFIDLIKVTPRNIKLTHIIEKILIKCVSKNSNLLNHFCMKMSYCTAEIKNKMRTTDIVLYANIDNFK